MELRRGDARTAGTPPYAVRKSHCEDPSDKLNIYNLQQSVNEKRTQLFIGNRAGKTKAKPRYDL